jgi:hypothetical protein
MSLDIIRTDSISSLMTALDAARQEFPDMPQNGYNPHFQSHYTELPDVVKGTSEALRKNGLILTQWPISEGESVGLLSILYHIPSGEHFGVGCTLPLSRKDAQVATAALTYLRRSGRVAIFDLLADTDDDGNSTNVAEQRKKDAPKKAVKPAPAKAAQSKSAVTPKANTETKPVSTDPDVIPTGDEFGKYRDRALVIGQKLFDAGLVEQPNRAIRKLLLAKTGAGTPELIKRGSWQDFLAHYEVLDLKEVAQAIDELQS